MICGKIFGEGGEVILDGIMWGRHFSCAREGRSNLRGYHDLDTDEDLDAILKAIDEDIWD